VNYKPPNFAKFFLVGDLFLASFTALYLQSAPDAVAETAAPPKRLTEEELVAMSDRLSRERTAKLGKVDVPPLPPPEIAEPESLDARSAILCFGGNLTFIPKKAVIHVPKEYAGRLIEIADARVLTWTEFFPLNRGWITTVEVTLAQAEGKEPLPTTTIDKIEKSGNLTIATMNGNPITVLPPVVTKETSEKSDQTTPIK
jgi:hypothetical protein